MRPIIFSVIAWMIGIAIPLSAQELQLQINVEGIKLHNPSEKRLNNSNTLKDAYEQFVSDHTVRSNNDSKCCITLPISQIDSLMALPMPPEYILIESDVCTLSDMDAIISAQKVRLEKLKEDLTARSARVNTLKSNLGKKLTDKEDKSLIIEIIEELGSRDIHPSSKALEDLRKDKISKDLADIFDTYLALLTLKTYFSTQNIDALNGENFADSKYKVLYSLMKYPTYDDLPADIRHRTETRRVKLFWAPVSESELKFPIKAVFDSIPNPLTPKGFAMFPENLSKINRLKIDDAHKEFAWLESDEYTVETEQYPMPITYRRYASHPQYKVTNSDNTKAVFDIEGNLVAYITGHRGFRPVGNNINAIYEHEFNANSYGIQNRSNHVKDHILEKAEVKFREGSRAQRIAKARIKHIDEASLARPDNDYMVKAILADREASRITKQDELDHLKYFDRDGENWCRQIESNWNQKISENGPSWTEILSPTSFSVTYMDNEGKPAIKEFYQVRNTTPYRIETVKTVKIL